MDFRRCVRDKSCQRDSLAAQAAAAAASETERCRDEREREICISNAIPLSNHNH